MQILAAGNPNQPAPRGFTLLELLVVVAIVALATAGVGFAIRSSSDVALEREAQRLAALLESARAQSRLMGMPVVWYPSPQGFVFQGAGLDGAPQAWLDAQTQVVGNPVLELGPEPMLEPQAVTLMSAAQPTQTLRLETDGVGPFTVQTP